MDDIRVGKLIRATRRRRRLRQADVGAMAGVSQQTVSRVERGQFEKAGLRAVRAVAAALSISLPFEPRAPAGDLLRLSDARHLAVVKHVVAVLEAAAWVVRVEYSFSHYGERGCVDVLAWHASGSALLIVECKSEIVDVQTLLRTIDVRDRVLRQLAVREFGQKPLAVASVLVVADDSSNRRAVLANRAVFDLALPARTVSVKRWLQDPKRDLRAIWWVAPNATRKADRNDGGHGRIRRG